MQKPVLVVLAAGMGSRYGGLKQIDPVGPDGEVIIDYSLFDARAAGFETVVFIIKRAIEKDFHQAIGNRVSRYMEVRYAYQELEKLPAGYSVPEGRVKPWGTAHAVLAAKEVINGPFAVINADDYYGPAAYRQIYEFLTAPQGDGQHYAMVGYRIENTVSDSGSVARGVCEADPAGYLTAIVERTRVEKTAAGARFTEDDGNTWTDLPTGTLVSMNFWGFVPGVLPLIEADFSLFLDENLPKNPLKCEYLLPNYVGQLVAQGRADVRVLESKDIWYGVTYKEDKPKVMAALLGMHQAGAYPTPLWGNMA